MDFGRLCFPPEGLLRGKPKVPILESVVNESQKWAMCGTAKAIPRNACDVLQNSNCCPQRKTADMSSQPPVHFGSLRKVFPTPLGWRSALATSGPPSSPTTAIPASSWARVRATASLSRGTPSDPPSELASRQASFATHDSAATAATAAQASAAASAAGRVDSSAARKAAESARASSDLAAVDARSAKEAANCAREAVRDEGRRAREVVREAREAADRARVAAEAAKVVVLRMEMSINSIMGAVLELKAKSDDNASLAPRAVSNEHVEGNVDMTNLHGGSSQDLHSSSSRSEEHFESSFSRHSNQLPCDQTVQESQFVDESGEEDGDSFFGDKEDMHSAVRHSSESRLVQEECPEEVQWVIRDQSRGRKHDLKRSTQVVSRVSLTPKPLQISPMNRSIVRRSTRRKIRSKRYFP